MTGDDVEVLRRAHALFAAAAGHRPIEIPISYNSRSFKEGKKIRMFRDPLTWLVAWAKSRFGPL